MKMEFSALARSTQGTGASRRLRNAGRVPGILYGGDKPAQAIELDQKDLLLNLRNEAFHASILTMDLGGQKEPVLLRDVQMHPFKHQVTHVDFQRVAKDRKIHMKVPLHFTNEAGAPGLKAGGVVGHVLNELDVQCLPDDLPEFIELDLSSLDVGSSIHLSEITLPKGVEAVVLRRGEDPVVVTCQVPRVVEVVEAAPVEGAVPAEGVAPGAAPAAAAPAAAEKKEEKKEEKKG